MNRLTRISATVASSACLIAGVAGVAGAAPDVSGNGNGSANNVSQTTDHRMDMVNRTRVRAVNNNPQNARSGDVTVDDNRNVDGPTSGTAANKSDTAASVTVDYTKAAATPVTGGSGSTDSSSSSSSPTVTDNGNNSDNVVTTSDTVRTDIKNRSNIRVENNNTQNAVSGNVSASDNRNVGSLSSGNVSNTSLNTFNVNVTY